MINDFLLSKTHITNNFHHYMFYPDAFDTFPFFLK
jgi:hypothetical protein